MEKYSPWNDKNTGVNPFTAERKLGRGNGHGFVRSLLGLVLIVVRIPLFLLALLLVALVDILQLLVPFWPYRYFVRWLLMGPLCRLLLYILGFWFVTERVPDIRRLRIATAPKQKRGKKPRFGAGISSGDIILCNRTSFVEELYLAASFRTDFSTNSLKRSSSVTSSLWRAAMGTTRSSAKAAVAASLEADKCNPIVKTASSAGSCSGAALVVFPESAHTNGTALLNFSPQFIKSFSDSIDAMSKKKNKTKVHLIGFKYEFINFSPCHSATSFFGYLMGLMFQVKNNMVVTHLSHQGLQTVEEYRRLLAAIVCPKGVIQVDLGVERYAAFLDRVAEANAEKTSKNARRKKKM